MATMVQRIVKEQVAKGEKSAVAVTALNRVQLYVGNGVDASYLYFRSPVTECIPPQQPPKSNYVSDQYRRKKKVYVSTVKVELTVAHLHGFRLAGIMYPVPVVKADPDEDWISRGDDGVPSEFALGKKDGKGARMLTQEEAGIGSGPDGPFRVKSKQSESMDVGEPMVRQYRLSTANGRMFGCPLVQGMIPSNLDWTVGKETHTGCKMMNAEVGPPQSVFAGSGYGQEVSVKGIWHVEDYVEFEMEDSGKPKLGEALQCLFELSACSVPFGLPDGDSTPSAQVLDFETTVYYSS